MKQRPGAKGLALTCLFVAFLFVFCGQAAFGADPRISGHVTDSKNKGIVGVKLEFSNLGGSTYTDSDGFYSQPVSSGWTGTVTPSKICTRFEPRIKTFATAVTQDTTLDFKGEDGVLIRGQVTQDSKPVSGVRVAFTGQSSVLTGTDGYYIKEVPCYWSGTITPTKTGLKFVPESSQASRLSATENTFDFTAGAGIRAAGYVKDIRNRPVYRARVSFSGGGGYTYTNRNGFYKKDLSYGWKGRITVVKRCLRFVPSYKDYTTQQKTNFTQNFSSRNGIMVYGRILNKGKAVQGVTVTLKTLGRRRIYKVTTNNSGIYGRILPCGWSGSITPQKTGLLFTPSVRNVKNLRNSIYWFNFTGATAYKVTGFVKDKNGKAISRAIVSFTGSTSVRTSTKGYYKKLLPLGYSGRVSVSKNCYTITPLSSRISNLSANSRINFTARYGNTVKGSVTMAGGALSRTRIAFSNRGGSTYTGTTGEYTKDLRCNWRGTVKPTQRGYTFTPAVKVINSLNGEQTVDFKALPKTKGDTPLLVILLNYRSPAFLQNETFWQTRFFGRRPSYSTVRHYYQKQSQNKFVVLPAQESYAPANNGVVKVSVGTTHPNPGGTASKLSSMAQIALLRANRYVNFKRFDTDRNGWVSKNELHIAIVVAGYQGAQNNNTPAVNASFQELRWSRKLDGVYVARYSVNPDCGAGVFMFGEREIHSSKEYAAPLGVQCKLLGRSLGLPELLDTTDTSYGIGVHGLMGYGYLGKYLATHIEGQWPTNMCAWSRIQLGWVEPTVIPPDTAAKAYTLYPAYDGRYQPLRMNTSDPKQYFLVENRGLRGYDLGMLHWFTTVGGGARKGGVAVWHINEANANNDNVNKKLVDLEEANQAAEGKSQLDTKVNYGIADQYYQATGVQLIDDTTDPNTKLADGTASNVSVNVDSQSGFNFTVTVKSK